MPRTKSAKRALKKNIRNRQINEKRKNKIKKVVKNFLSLVKEKNKEQAQEALRLVYKELDKAGKRFLDKNKISRLKSRYAKLLSGIK